jgi:hypothetical protein
VSNKTLTRAVVDEEAQQNKIYKQRKHSTDIEEVLDELDDCEDLNKDVLDYVKKYLK